MASAGKILITPKGKWSAETEYEILDLVSHNGKAWLSKKAVVGIEPSDDEEGKNYWHDLIEVTPESIGAMSTKGGTVSGQLAVNGGKGVLGANDYGAFVQVKDGTNVRHLRVENPSQNLGPNSWAQVVDTVNGTPHYYNLFGEHNIEYLKELLGLA